MYVYTYIHTYIPVTRAGGFGQLKGIALFQVTYPSRARALGVPKKQSGPTRSEPNCGERERVRGMGKGERECV